MGAKKYLGQNFLQNKRKLERIVGALDATIPMVVEIGPGHGDLTRFLLGAGFVVYAIEKDPDMMYFLQKKFADEIASRKLKLIEGDALEKISNFQFLISNKNKDAYLVVGNIPYYITGKLFRALEELPHKPRQAILLVQREVADRVCAKAGSMNLLAASAGWWADARVITGVPRSMFNPPPKVDSAVIELKTRIINHETRNVERETYFKCVHVLFKQPRKTIVKNLTDAGITREHAQHKVMLLGLVPTARPQDVSIKQIALISDLF